MADSSRPVWTSNGNLSRPSGSTLPFDHPEDGDIDHSDSTDEEEIEKRRARHSKRVNTLSKGHTDDEEQAVLRILDRKLVLFLAFLYLLSFLDRSNIGNARIAGLEQALKMNDAQFDLCLVAFYVTYITFEWMILLYRLIPPHIYISLCVFFWGLVASLQSVVTSFRQLLLLRSFLGITEAAFGPGVPFYMTFFYRRSELAYRVGLQISAAPLATSFASSLAWLIVKLSQNGPLEPWRALFLFEGFPSIIAAFFAWHFIPDSPETARYLTPRQRKVAKLRLHSSSFPPPSSSPSSSSSSSSRVNWTELGATLLDTKAWLTSLMFLSVNVSFSSLPVFLPTIIASMSPSFSPVTSQILSAPPYLMSFIFVLAVGYHSDKRPGSRSLFLAAAACLSAASYFTIALAGYMHTAIGDAGSVTLRYVSVFGAAMGLFASVTLIITWSLNNQRSATGKGVGLMILNVVGQTGPLLGVKLFPERDGPFYVRGMAACGAFMLAVASLAVALRLWLGRLNRQLDLAEYVGKEGGGSAGERGYEMSDLRERRELARRRGSSNEDDEEVVDEGGTIGHRSDSGREDGDKADFEEAEGLLMERNGDVRVNVLSRRDGFRYML